MKPTVEAPLRVRGLEFGGAKPLFCIPIVPVDAADLAAQAEIAHRLGPDLVEWRADFYQHSTPEAFLDAARVLRQSLPSEAIVFTLRWKAEGGVREIPQPLRQSLIETVLRSGCVDIIDLELASEPAFLDPLLSLARDNGVRVILAMHNFTQTPPTEDLLGRVAAMNARGADIAKLAVMPQTAADVMRLFQVIVEARRQFPHLPLAIMSMGALGSITRVAGFLYGSDMAFAVGKEASAPGQIPIEDARRMAELLLRYS
ncbi:MAG: type I 3-dehydroquinate dehydratase [Bryobacterales bacterium]|nr:type I 3-dehydroquinate dehydratase [Bryobacterales bacterium]